jgi:hypothetical protein
MFQRLTIARLFPAGAANYELLFQRKSFAKSSVIRALSHMGMHKLIRMTADAQQLDVRWIAIGLITIDMMSMQESSILSC